MISFGLFLRYELMWDYQDIYKLDTEKYIQIYSGSINIVRWVFNSLLLLLQILRFLASRIPALTWFDDHLSNFSYLMIIFFIIIFQNEMINYQSYSKSFHTYNFFLKIRRQMCIRLKVHETFIKKIEQIFYRMIIDENKKSNLNKVFAIIDHKIKLKKQKKELSMTMEKFQQKLSERPKYFYLKNKSVDINPAEISMSDEVINTYSTNLFDIIKSSVKSNKYYYFNLLEQMEYMFFDYDMHLTTLQKYNFLCDFAEKKLFENPSFLALKNNINITPKYIHNHDIKKNLSKNIFNLKSSRQYLDKDPSLIFVVKKWIFHWIIMNTDFILKLVIILLCTLDASLLMKLPVAMLIFIDLCLTVSDSRYNLLFYFFMLMFVLKTISHAVIPFLGNSLYAKNVATFSHCFFGDFSIFKTNLSLLLLVIIYMIDLYKAKESFYKYYIKHNIFTIFSKTHKSSVMMYRILKKYFVLEEEEAEIRDKRIRFGIFKMKLVCYYTIAKKRMMNYMKNRYLFNLKMGPNFKNIEENIFHPYLFKSGVELYSSIIIIQLVFIVYNIVFWDNMYTNSSSLLESITTSELKGSLVLFILVVAACMLIDAILINTNSAEYNKIQRFVELSNGRDKYLKKFKSCALKIININRIRKKDVVLKSNHEQQIKDRIGEEFSRTNPTFPKFSFTIVMWLIFNLFLWGMLFSKKLNLASISNAPIKEFMSALQNTDNIFVLGGEIIFLIYTLLSISFIRHGLKMKQFYKSDQLSEVGVKIMEKLNSVPYFRELRVYLFWTARKTTLDYEDWFIIDYCYFQMMERFDMDYESREEIEPQPKWYKMIFGLGPLIAILLILLGPLVLFSSFNPINTPNTIKSFNVDFSLEIEEFGIFNLFNMSKCNLFL